jgi:hypothetical protein
MIAFRRNLPCGEEVDVTVELRDGVVVGLQLKPADRPDKVAVFPRLEKARLLLELVLHPRRAMLDVPENLVVLLRRHQARDLIQLHAEQRVIRRRGHAPCC